MSHLIAKKHYFNQTPLYERNYGKLLGYFRASPAAHISVRHSSGVAFRILVIEDHRYTSVLGVSVSMSGGAPSPTDMHMTVRMCHDAKVAEVMACCNDRDFAPEYSYPNPRMHHRDEKHQVNRLLGEWLDFFAERQNRRVSEPEGAL